MIDKVIIAEDHESSNLSVEKTIEDLRISKRDYVFYCDDALNKIQAAGQKGEPYDLLITDLSFEDDGTSQKIIDGFELIRAAREIQPAIMVLVFSADNRPATIHSLYEDYGVDAYVRKARHDIKELILAFEALAKGQKYYPHSLVQMMREHKDFKFTATDLIIIHLIGEGYDQKEIEKYLKKNNIEPSSLSSIEKRLKLLRDEFNFSKNTQLVVHCKEKRLL